MREQQLGRNIIKFIPLLAACIGISISTLVLIGWAANNAILERINNALPAMNPVTAVCIFLSSITLLLSIKENKLLKRIAIALSLIILATASLRITEFFFTLPWSIDLILWKERVLDPANPPARMAMATAINFFLLSGSLLLIQTVKTKSSSIIAQICILFCLLISFFALLFYTVNWLVFLQTPLFLSMAIHTAFTFLILSIGVSIIVRKHFADYFYLSNPLVISLLFFIHMPIWIYGIAPELTKLPQNFSYEANIYSIDNLYDETKKQFTGEILSNTKFSYKVVGIKDGKLLMKNIFDVRTPTGEKIFSVERLYGIDPQTRMHASGYGDHDRAGYLFGPRNAKKEGFNYWHVNYDMPIHLSFAGEEQIQELKVYKYEGDFHADQTKNLTNLPEVGKTRGINLDGHITLWIEPVTGRMIKYTDQATAYYYDLATGKRLYPWNSFSNRFTRVSVGIQINQATSEMQQIILIDKVTPAIFALLGLFCFLFFLAQKIGIRKILPFLPYGILILFLTITYFTWKLADNNIRAQESSKFLTEITDIEDLITNRLAIYTNALKGGQGLFDIKQPITRQDWKSYVDSLSIQRSYPGIQGMGVSLFVPANQLTQHISKIRQEGFPTYTVWPAGKRDIYSAVVYLEPFDSRNQRAFGLDMFNEPIRREAMIRARDTGLPALSGSVILAQETNTDIQHGFLLYLPLYKANAKVDTVEERKKNIIGYVYAPFRVGDFMKDILANQNFTLDVEILDKGKKIYNSPATSKNEKPLVIKDQQITLYGKTWTIHYEAGQDFGIPAIQQAVPKAILGIGIVISILLFITVLSLTTTQRRAIGMAETMTEDIREKNKQLEIVNTNLSKEVAERKKAEEILQNKTDELERTNDAMVGRELKMIALKKQLKEKNHE